MSSRNGRKQIAEETLRMTSEGAYVNAQGQEVSIAKTLAAAKHGSQLVRPDDFSGMRIPKHDFETFVEVENETTLAGAKALLDQGAEKVCLLNFASAKNPGGGFLGGSQAQEESLARASGLYDCLLQARAYYEFHRSASRDGLYSHHMIYAPEVPVFRDDSDQLLDQPWGASMITAAAVNAGAVRRNHPNLADQIETVMAERLQRVLRLAAAKGHHHLVLGAWGCGVFRNDPDRIATLFARALASDKFYTVFERIRFSVLDHSVDLTTYNAFASRL